MLHIGDNLTTDFCGARAAGMQALYLGTLILYMRIAILCIVCCLLSVVFCVGLLSIACCALCTSRNVLCILSVEMGFFIVNGLQWLNGLLSQLLSEH